MMTILVVAAHPDDESLGCAATVAKHIASGAKAHVIYLTDGEGAREASDPSERRLKADRAAEIIGFESVTYLNFPDNQMDSVPLLDIIKAIESHIQQISPTVVYTHWGQDLNIDHRLCYQAVVTACRPTFNNSVKSIYSFEIRSSSEWCSLDGVAFQPNIYVDIEGYLETKLGALRAYGTEIPEENHARSIEAVTALAKLRGSESGLVNAEAFRLIRSIES